LGWNLKTINAAAAEMFVDGPPENTFPWISEDGWFQLPQHKRLWLGLLLPQLRGLVHKYPDHPGLHELEMWCEKTPSVAPTWLASGMPSYVTPDGDTRPFIHAKYGLGKMAMGVLTPHRVEDRDLRIFFMDFIYQKGPHQKEILRLLHSDAGKAVLRRSATIEEAFALWDESGELSRILVELCA
jgi:hypothetical protein